MPVPTDPERYKEWKRKLSEARKNRPRTPKEQAVLDQMHEMRKGTKHSEETKEEMRQKATGRKLSEETKKKIGLSRVGFTHAEESKEKIRAASTGKAHTEESKRKIGYANRGRKVSKEERERISKEHLKMWQLEEHRQRMAQTHWSTKSEDEVETIRQKIAARQLGQKESEATRLNMSRMVKARWDAFTDEERKAYIERSLFKTPKINTKIERIVQECLEEIGIEYIPQHWVHGYPVDFYFPGCKIVLECDGDYWHRRTDIATHDEKKNAKLKAHGYTVIRLWESFITQTSHDQLCRHIKEVLGCTNSENS